MLSLQDLKIVYIYLQKSNCNIDTDYVSERPYHNILETIKIVPTVKTFAKEYIIPTVSNYKHVKNIQKGFNTVRVPFVVKSTVFYHVDLKPLGSMNPDLLMDTVLVSEVGQTCTEN